MHAKPDLYKDDLPDYGYIRRALADSVLQALDRDFDLIALGGHEQSVAHRIGVYLEAHFSGYAVDCEYNRQKHKTKARPAETDSAAPKKMRPDIIVHVRNSGQNVLAVEMKANANEDSTDDLAKLKTLRADKTYLYKGIAFVRIHNAITEMQDGCLRATICWYDVARDKIIEQDENRDELICSTHKEQVKDILRQRGAQLREGVVPYQSTNLP